MGVQYILNIHIYLFIYLEVVLWFVTYQPNEHVIC